MAEQAISLDAALLRGRPLPQPPVDVDKNERGRVLAVGGSVKVPGGLALCCEAALRAGAGKVQAAVPASLAVGLGMVLPEIGVIALPEAESEIAGTGAIEAALGECDAVLAGPAMVAPAAAERVASALLAGSAAAGLVLDAAVLGALGSCRNALRARKSPALLTPHVGEMGWLLDREADHIESDREGAVRRAAVDYGAVVVLKGAKTLVAAPDGTLFVYDGGGVGLATGGSGDVLAGIATGLIARGASPLDAALWAVWLHGQAGRRCAETIGPLGFLARELLPLIPALMREN